MDIAYVNFNVYVVKAVHFLCYNQYCMFLKLLLFLADIPFSRIGDPPFFTLYHY